MIKKLMADIEPICTVNYDVNFNGVVFSNKFEETYRNPPYQQNRDDSIEKPRMRYFCGNPIVCHRREADCSDADGRHLSRAFRF
jgi:hypothetical protein